VVWQIVERADRLAVAGMASFIGSRAFLIRRLPADCADDFRLRRSISGFAFFLHHDFSRAETNLTLA
jgi:hypothetical protein